MNDKESPPVVICCSGNDPSGGAGIQADISTVLSMGCHAAPVVTAITVQNSRGLIDFTPVELGLFIQQMRAVLEDYHVAAIKIGMLGSAQIAEAIHTMLNDYPDIPVVLDPVLLTGFGQGLTQGPVSEVMKSLLLNQVKVLTPNGDEARHLAPEADTLGACGQALLDLGCEFVLITGADEPTTDVANILYSNRRELETFRWPRIAGVYHGSGCTLAAASAALLAQGCETVTAIRQAQSYTWKSIQNGYVLSTGQRIPQRLPWLVQAN